MQTNTTTVDIVVQPVATGDENLHQENQLSPVTHKTALREASERYCSLRKDLDEQKLKIRTLRKVLCALKLLTTAHSVGECNVLVTADQVALANAEMERARQGLAEKHLLVKEQAQTVRLLAHLHGKCRNGMKKHHKKERRCGHKEKRMRRRSDKKERRHSVEKECGLSDLKEKKHWKRRHTEEKKCRPSDWKERRHSDKKERKHCERKERKHYERKERKHEERKHSDKEERKHSDKEERKHSDKEERKLSDKEERKLSEEGSLHSEKEERKNSDKEERKHERKAKKERRHADRKERRTSNKKEKSEKKDCHERCSYHRKHHVE